MFRHLQRLSIAVKLTLVQSLVLLVIIIAATVATVWQLRVQMERKEVHNLQQTNRLVVSMLDAYDQSMRNDVERSGRLFAASFDGPLELIEGGASPQLLLRGTRVQDRLDLVDAFTARSGALVTIFVRQGDDFLRTATSVKKEDGTRAIGTLLAADHPARKALLAGNSFTGKATLFGKDFITHYAPLKDPGGKVVGSAFAGLDLTEGFTALKQKILAIKIGETGYVFALDAGVHKGLTTIHPTREGVDFLAVKDSNGFEFVREMVEKKSGVVRYDWANPDEASPRQKVVVFDHYPGWDWVIASGSYVEEITRDTASVVRDIALMALTIIVAAVVSVFIATRIWVARPLQEVVLAADRIATGDLTGQLSAAGGDEIGRLKQAVGKMADNLKGTIGDIRKASATMLEQSGALVTSAEQVNQSSQQQSDAASGMAASVERMSVSVDQVAQHASDAQRMSCASGQVATQGAAIIQQATGAMNQINGFVRAASGTVADLGHRSQDISAVVHVIQEIAEQTNLLALNAAIEAARAGQQGRGFAVVADEVRKLAERTAISTKSIDAIVTSIHDGVEAAVRQMEEGVAQVEQGSVLADQAGQAISDIDASTKEVIVRVAGISQAISEQGTASQAIAAGVDQVARMAGANHRASQTTTHSAQALRDLVARLDQTLGRFHID